MDTTTTEFPMSWLAAVRIASMVLQNEAAPMEAHKEAQETLEQAARLADLYAAEHR